MPPKAISLSIFDKSFRKAWSFCTDPAASECRSRRDPSAVKKDVEAVDIEEIRWISTVSRYHESFSCKMALVARAFLPAGRGSSNAPLVALPLRPVSLGDL